MSPQGKIAKKLNICDKLHLKNWSMSDANLQSDWLTNGSTGVFLDFMKFSIKTNWNQ